MNFTPPCNDLSFEATDFLDLDHSNKSTEEISDQIPPELLRLLKKCCQDIGVSKVADFIMNVEDLEDEIFQKSLIKMQGKFKESLKKSILKRDSSKEYLLSLTPEKLVCLQTIERMQH